MEEKEGQGELSVHPGLVKLCAAFTVDPVPRVRGANANAWAYPGQLADRHQSNAAFSQSLHPECRVWP